MSLSLSFVNAVTLLWSAQRRLFARFPCANDARAPLVLSSARAMTAMSVVLLPCLVAFGVSAVSLVASFFYLEESMAKRTPAAAAAVVAAA